MTRRRLCVAVCLVVVLASPVAAAITASNLIVNGSAASATSYVTASASPTANRLQIMWVSNTAGVAAGTPTVTGASMTWDQVGTCTLNGGVRRITAFRALSASPGSGALTIDFAGATQTTAQWIVDQFDGMETTGSNGSGAIVANALSITNSTCTFNSGTTTGVTTTISALSNANNASVGYVRNNASPAVTAGSGYTKLGALNSIGDHSEYQAPGSTTVDFTWSSQSVSSTLAGLEIAVLGGGVTVKPKGTLLGVLP